MNFGERDKLKFHDLKVPSRGSEDFILLEFGISSGEYGDNPTANSSLVEIKHAASSTPIGLWGTNGAKLLPTLVEAWIKGKSLISSRHFRILSCKMKTS